MAIGKYFLAVSAMFVVGAGPASADQLQGQLGVKITVGSGCTVVNGGQDGTLNAFGTLDFGTHYELNNNVSAQSNGSMGPMAVQCSNDTGYTVALGSGQNPGGSERQMSGGGNPVRYQLFQDAARTTQWGDGTNFGQLLSKTGSGIPQDITVYGLVPPQSTPTAGTYNDVVLVTVAW
ncbi:spore coat protein U-like protein [Paraburkholderia caballeronis]|uniref:Csu type fimbrial protein n=1 Tax=Paraburkholderia caballeronis TaxID=416943 RepID=UPI0010D0D222|nr:spore coat U domain-containing protein [Paraburkholderia caballeronis]TDV35747.1 spore coat protein U-like protein [Paraburkholderia caballeronis]